MSAPIKVVRLIDGTEILGEVMRLPDAVVVENPLSMRLIGGDDAPRLVFSELFLCSNEKRVKLSSSHVLYIYEPVDEIRNQYRAKFAGLVLPKTPSQLLVEDV